MQVLEILAQFMASFLVVYVVANLFQLFLNRFILFKIKRRNKRF